MAVYFISDLHLTPEKPAMTAGFLAFIQQLDDAEALYILGDFFEVWIGDDITTELTRQVEQALADLSQRGCHIFIMHGNRDFLLGSDFCQRIGGSLINEYTIIALGDSKILLLHGDSLCTRDTEYQQVRQMFRNPQWQQQFLSQSIDDRIAFARKVRDQSQKSGQMKDNDIMDVTLSEVDQALDEANVNSMIHGHTHRPATHQWQQQGAQRQRWVLGDWSDSHGWMIRWTVESGLLLSEFLF
jgi:UDP-2,3-diacylglucosamine hydrolase